MGVSLAMVPSSLPESPGGEIGALAEGAQLRPRHALLDELRAREGAEATVHAGEHARAVADRLGDGGDAIGDDLRMLDDVRRGVDDAGHEQHAGGQRVAAQRLQLVLVARARERQRERADLCAIDDRQQRLQRHVVRVRPVVVAPAEVQANAIGGQPRDRLVDGVDVQGDGPQEAVERLVLEEARALHGQVRAVELQHEAARHDQLVFLAHLARERLHIALVGAVVGVQHDGGDHAGRGGRHERLRELVGARGAPEQLALGRGLAEVGVGDLGDRLRRVIDARSAGALARQPRGVVRMLGDVPRHPPRARAAEAPHPPRRIGGEADARLLAIVADVDAGLELAGDHVAHGRLRLARERRRIDRLPAVQAHQQIAQRGRTRQAAGVGGQDSGLASLHRGLRRKRGLGYTMRRVAARMHLWGGLVTGPLLLVLGLSGSALVFGPELEQALDGLPVIATTATSAPSLDAVVAAAVVGQPGAERRALHRIVGGGSLVVGVVVGLTGTMLALASASLLVSPSLATGDLTRLDFVAERVPAHGRITALVAEPGHRVRVDARKPDGGVGSVVVDGDSGAIVATGVASTRDAWDVVRRLHAGDFAGWASRLVYAGVGLALPMLSITGFLISTRRRA